MRLILQPDTACNLRKHYHEAFTKAVELLIVNAYLTEWEPSLPKPACRHFRMIIGKDFGLTKKSACRAVMNWLPPGRKAQFMVADQIGRFHPKAVFWKEASGQAFAIVGSSNLTAAAFGQNYEVNVYGSLSSSDCKSVMDWIKVIEDRSVIVSEDWLENHQEAKRTAPPEQPRFSSHKRNVSRFFRLPRPNGINGVIKGRREILAQYEKNRGGLMRLFEDCANGQISSAKFYEKLSNYWGGKVGGRLSGKGFEISGKHSDFQALSENFFEGS